MPGDNFVAVFCSIDSLGRPARWYVAHGFMSSIENHDDERLWKKSMMEESDSVGRYFHTRASALLAAHDLARIEFPEYGVIEMHDPILIK